MSEHANRLRKMRVLLPGLIGVDASPDDDAALDAAIAALDEVDRLRAALADKDEALSAALEDVGECGRLSAELAALRERQGDARRLADYIASLYEHNEIQDDDIYRLAVNFDKPATPEPAPAQPTCPECGGTGFVQMRFSSSYDPARDDRPCPNGCRGAR